MDKTGSERPIGYWLKKLDRLIDMQFDQQLGEVGLSRRQWQLLNLLKNGPRSEPELKSELEPFLQQAPDDLTIALSGLVTRGWADSQDTIVTLTDTGQAQFELIKARWLSCVKNWRSGYHLRSTERLLTSSAEWQPTSNQMWTDGVRRQGR